MVSRYMRMINQIVKQDGPIYKHNDIAFERTPIPPEARESASHTFWRDEHKKFKPTEKDGVWTSTVAGMCGMQYSYFNYYRAKKRGAGGLIYQNYRVHDNETHALIESCLYGDNEWYQGNKPEGRSVKGIYILGARGKGKSQKLGNAALNVAVTTPFMSVALQSKTEKDGEILLKEKVKTPYNYYPAGLKPSRSSNAIQKVYFSKEEDGVVSGLETEIFIKAPGIGNFDGTGCRMIFMDEFPITDDPIETMQSARICLAGEDGMTIEGLQILAGVAGEKHLSEDTKAFWYNAHNEDFLRWFVPAWIGMRVDEFGNDRIEESVRYILTERMKKKDNPKAFMKAVLSYPLTPDECFLSGTGDVLPNIIISKQQTMLDHTAPSIKKGKLTIIGDKEVRFDALSSGKLHILEHPIQGQTYLAAIDSYDIKTKNSGDKSEGVTVIVKPHNPLYTQLDIDILEGKIEETEDINKKVAIALDLGWIIVAVYRDNQPNTNKYSKEAANLCVYYNNAKVLIERKPTTIYSWFKDNGYKYLMAYEPIPPNKERQTKTQRRTLGIQITEYFAVQRLQELYSYFENYSSRVFFQDILSDATEYDPEIQRRKKDSIDALGIALIFAKDSRTKSYLTENAEESVAWRGWKRKDLVN